MNLRNLIFPLFLLCFSSIPASGVIPGSLDPGFDPGTGVGGDFQSVQCLALQDDGKLIIAGRFSSYDGIPRNRIARLNTDGTLDSSFNPGAGPNGDVFSIAIQSDGKVLLGGGFSEHGGTDRNGISRLNPDGSLDSGFDPGSGLDGKVLCIAVQSDGKILVGGDFTECNGSPSSRITRLNDDGSRDEDFNPGTGVQGDLYVSVNSIALQTDGRVLIVGEFSDYGGTPRNGIARVRSDGTLDESFEPGTGADYGGENGRIQSIAVQGDGKLIIGGYFDNYRGTARNRIARLESNGSLDISFDPGTGFGADVAQVNAILAQADGRILVAGAFQSFQGISRSGIARLNGDGSLDSSFAPGSGAGGDSSEVNALVGQADGKILIGGRFSTYAGSPRGRIARINENGTIDPDFETGPGVTGGIEPSSVLSIALQPNGKLIIGGDFTSYNGRTRNGIARLNRNGSLDTSFNPGRGTGDAPASILSLAVLPDGRVLVGGDFTSYDGNSRNRIARTKSDGSLDPTFNPGSGLDGSVFAIALQPDGRVIIGGEFTTCNGTSRARIARLNPDGSLDGGFDPGSGIAGAIAGANTSVHSINLQPDGKIVIAGTFTSYGGVARNGIVRLHPNGGLDTSFNPGTGPTLAGLNGSVTSLVLNPDGKMTIVGLFDSYRVTARNRIARLNENGTSDNSFNPGTGAGAGFDPHSIESVADLPGGKLLIGGLFTDYNGVPRSGIARINPDGSIDGSFDPGSGVGGGLHPASVNAISLEADGALLIGGDFTTYQNQPRGGIARLINDGLPPWINSPTATGITASGATLGGNVTDDSGEPVLERGVVYAIASANASPLIGGEGVAKVTTVGTTGVFTLPVPGLSSGTIYRFKAYATNANGTNYSAASTFTTLSTNANLSSLVLDGPGLSPAFAATTSAYSATLRSIDATLRLRPSVAQSGASLFGRVNGGEWFPLESGPPSAPLSMKFGPNSVEIRVLAEDGITSRTYTIAAHRNEPKPDAMVGDSLAFMNGANVYQDPLLQRLRLVSIMAWGVDAFASVANRGNVPDRYNLRGSGGSRYFKIDYRDKTGGLITSAILTGRYQTPERMPGDPADWIYFNATPQKRFILVRKGARVVALRKSRLFVISANSVLEPGMTDGISIRVETR